MPWNLQPFPTFFFGYFIDRSQVNMKFSGNDLRTNSLIIFFTYLQNIIGFEFVGINLFSFRGFTMFFSVIHVLFGSIPSEIYNSIVRWNTIIVTSLIASWPFSNKCFEYKLMNQARKMYCVFYKCYISISKFCITDFDWMSIRQEGSISISITMIRFYISKITCFISRKIGDWSPYLFHFVSYKKLTGFESVSLSRRYGKTSERNIISDLRHKPKPYHLDKFIIPQNGVYDAI